METADKKLPEKDIGIVIPAYNASNHIETVVKRIPDSIRDRIDAVWIVNDGSTDDTAEKIERLAQIDRRIQCVQFNANRGYGYAVREGLSRCRESSYDYAAVIHADGQYPPEVLPECVEKMDKEEIDLLQGSRIASGTALSGGMPLYKYVAGKLLTALENLIMKVGLTDYHSGLLVYGKRALTNIPFEKLSGSFDFDLEVIASAHARGLKVREIPIPTRYADEKSFLNPITYGIRVLKVVFRYALGKYR